MTVVSFPNLDRTGACNEFLCYNFFDVDSRKRLIPIVDCQRYPHWFINLAEQTSLPTES